MKLNHSLSAGVSHQGIPSQNPEFPLSATSNINMYPKYVPTPPQQLPHAGFVPQQPALHHHAGLVEQPPLKPHGGLMYPPPQQPYAISPTSMQPPGGFVGPPPAYDQAPPAYDQAMKGKHLALTPLIEFQIVIVLLFLLFIPCWYQV